MDSSIWCTIIVINFILFFYAISYFCLGGIMFSFREFVEANYNPLRNLYGNDRDLASTMAGVAAAPYAAAAGLGQARPTFNSWATGNPYGRNVGAAWKAFEQNRDFLLDLARDHHEWRAYLLSVLNAAETYLKTDKSGEVAGVTMGGGMANNSLVVAAFAALLKTAWTSLKNIVHTITNTGNGVIQQIGPKIQNMLYALDALPKERALDKIEEFRQRIQAGQGADSIDVDARMS